MEEAKFIAYEKTDNKGLDYEFLREEGIRLVQSLTGAFWTDYNVHDPGVTILEQLAYALTEISYRAQFDIKDILHSENQSDKSFFGPGEVLPCNALTVNDYRKYLFDSVFEIKNVWVFPVETESSRINGLYRVLIDVEESVSTLEEKEQVRALAYEAYNQGRNLCEDLLTIDVLEYVEFHLQIDIELTGEVSQEEVMGNIFYLVDDFLCPEMKFYSLGELLDQGYQLNDIFNGPLLKHGFVKTEDLPPKTDRILISEIMKIIMQVEGVSSVKNLNLTLGDEMYDTQIHLKSNQLPKLSGVKPNEEQGHQIHFYKGEAVHRKSNVDEVNRLLNELKSGNKRVYRLNEKTMDVPEGQSLDLKNYYSIQNQFPDVYGIGRDGIPGVPTIKRKGQAKQLKGYLMLFEQILANALAQLSHVKDLLSISEINDQSYYSQSLSTVPGAEDILRDVAGKKGESPVSYEDGLHQIMNLGEDHFDRVHRILDYLLALHGEEFGNHLDEFNYYYTEDEFQEYLIKNKTFFLRFIPFINHGRFKGHNYLEGDSVVGNVSGLEVKVSVLLGLSAFLNYDGGELNYKKKSLLDIFQKNKLTLATAYKEKEFDKGTVFIDKELVAERFELVDDEDVDIKNMTSEEKSAVIDGSAFFSRPYMASEELIAGLEVENYRVGTLTDKSKTASALYKIEHVDQWIELGQYKDIVEAERSVMLHIEFFKTLNVSTEGAHLVEHVLLRPDLEDQLFGLYLLNEKGKRVLGSIQTFSFEAREQEVTQYLAEHLKDRKNYSVEINGERDFEIHFSATVDVPQAVVDSEEESESSQRGKDEEKEKTKKLKIEFVSLHPNSSVEATHEEVDSLVSYFNNTQISLNSRIDYFIRNNDKGPRIPEDFYAHQLSVFLPDWTARFKNQEFRSVAEEIIFRQKPATIAANISWLSFEQMTEFESLYFTYNELKVQRRNMPKAFSQQKEVAGQTIENNEAYHKAIDELSRFVFQMQQQNLTS
ncbi:hypothetical protein N7E81_10200 [Reichenbachiella carrageenanivorans]|uniref:Uncharacterized protein n=1 Tax=Reichenbachiella carrageenanivorans TaxID=2979869 RepID=A0ABY6CUY9_9BACT|nr:hypothetical protein [Reichenbachiella carrageenanivorans]UXX77740.1 hypothetical protein N7E81_10200 [Reichenbachiella carrageenanivorans]